MGRSGSKAILYTVHVVSLARSQKRRRFEQIFGELGDQGLDALQQILIPTKADSWHAYIQLEAAKKLTPASIATPTAAELM